MTDMTPIIQARSDQQNADDFMSGPRTIKITKVSLNPGSEQPCSISFEGDDGKPWKPCKSMARVLVMVWGPDSSQYVGKSLTLYRDPDVKWGGLAVGGIRISHMSDMKSSTPLMLTVTRGKKVPYTVKPLEKPAPQKKQPFNWSDYEIQVDALIFDANDAGALESEWRDMRETRLAAGAEDPERAKALGDKVRSKIEELRGG